MSYIRKIGKNYVIQIYWQGEKRQFSLRVSDKKNAEKLQKQIEYEIAMGTFSPEKFFGRKNETITLADLKQKFLKFLDDRKNQFSPQTIKAYKYNLGMLEKILGDIELTKITSEIIEKDILTYLFNNYKRATVRHCISHFRTIFSKAANWQLITSNPFSGKVPKAERRKPRYLRQDEIETLKEYFAKPEIPKWQGDLVFFVLNTGLRKSEVFNLNWNNVDLFNEQLIFSGKGNKERYVPLNDKAMSLLIPRSKIRHLNDARVFREIKHPDSITTAWLKVQKRTGIKARFHDLRSTFASYYVMSGGELMALKEILGHEDIKTTMIYATLSREALHRKKNVVAF